jgi:hypothetical protein
MSRLDVLFEIISIFKKHNIDLLPFSGTLIGLLREQNIIKIDTGIDCIVNLNKFNNILVNNNKLNILLHKDLRKNNYTYIKSTPRIKNNKLFNLSLKKKNIRIDIGGYLCINNKYYEWLGYGIRLDKKFIDTPIHITEYHNDWKYDPILIPNYPEKLLEGIYNNEKSRKTSTKGNWRIPCKQTEITQNCSSAPLYVYLNDDLSIYAETWIKTRPNYKQYVTPEEYINYKL